MNLLGQYYNGNYKVKIFNDGTKIRETNDDTFVSSFPESIDLKITNYCDMDCDFCHEDSTIKGQHSNLSDIEFINTLKPYTELAIGGGNPLSHPQLIDFLTTLKSKNIIANITVNQKHFMSQQALIKYLVDNDLIKGLGVSLVKPTGKFIKTFQQYPNAVLHVINGVTTLNDLKKLYGKNLKMLILGYKEIRRGKDYYNSQVEANKKEIYDNIYSIIKGFKIVSFDNLAIRQLEIKRILTNKEWDQFYMGDDGQFTMYIDLVKKEFASSSTSMKRFRLKNNIIDMFNTVKQIQEFYCLGCD